MPRDYYDFSHSPTLKLTQVVKGDQHSKSPLANARRQVDCILLANMANTTGQDDDNISYPQHQEISTPPYKTSYCLQKQTANLTNNGNTDTRVPIEPYPGDMSYSMQGSRPVPESQTKLRDARYRRHNLKSTGVADNELGAIPGLHTNLSNAGLTSHDGKCKYCISKQQGDFQIKLEDDNKELKAILQEVRIITDKFRDEVRLAKYNSGKVKLSSIY